MTEAEKRLVRTMLWAAERAAREDPRSDYLQGFKDALSEVIRVLDPEP